MNENPSKHATAPAIEGVTATPNPTAFAEFVLKRHRLVRTYLAKYIQDMAVADQLASDVFLDFADSAVFDSVTSETLLQAARQRALDHLSTEAATLQRQPGKKVATLLSRWQMARLEGEAGSEQRHNAELDDLQCGAEILAPSSAALLDAHYRQGRTPEEMGASVGRDPDAIRQTLLKLRSALCADK